ncbi:hypothetical protein [Kitasatospora nipponensis]|uniref:hypothetical protein n=1 Tax=Kitasatospora nipponensis TaxID=258049 RepID=UPI0031CFFFB2
MTAERGRDRAGGCGWVLGAWVLATAGAFLGSATVVRAWHSCLGQDHESAATGSVAVVGFWAVLLTALLLLGALPGPPRRRRRWLWPAMLAVTAVLTWLFVVGMGTPPSPQPGSSAEVGCDTRPAYPFAGPG